MPLGDFRRFPSTIAGWGLAISEPIGLKTFLSKSLKGEKKKGRDMMFRIFLRIEK